MYGRDSGVQTLPKSVALTHKMEVVFNAVQGFDFKLVYLFSKYIKMCSLHVSKQNHGYPGFMKVVSAEGKIHIISEQLMYPLLQSNIYHPVIYSLEKLLFLHK